VAVDMAALEAERLASSHLALVYGLQRGAVDLDLIRRLVERQRDPCREKRRKPLFPENRKELGERVPDEQQLEQGWRRAEEADIGANEFAQDRGRAVEHNSHWDGHQYRRGVRRNGEAEGYQGPVEKGPGQQCAPKDGYVKIHCSTAPRSCWLLADAVELVLRQLPCIDDLAERAVGLQRGNRGRDRGLVGVIGLHVDRERLEGVRGKGVDDGELTGLLEFPIGNFGVLRHNAVGTPD